MTNFAFYDFNFGPERSRFDLIYRRLSSEFTMIQLVTE